MKVLIHITAQVIVYALGAGLVALLGAGIGAAIVHLLAAIA